MTISERKQQYQKQFEETAQKIQSLEAGLKQSYTLLEQIRGAFVVLNEMEKEETKVSEPGGVGQVSV